MDRGSSIYQDLLYIFYMVATNAAILLVLFLCLVFFMAHYGYKTITIKLNKKNKFIKQLKKYRKLQEENYLDKLSTDLKTTKKKKKS